MNKKITFIFICIALSLFCISCTSAVDSNAENITDNDFQLKESPVISVNTSSVYTQHSIGIFLKDLNDTPLSNQNLTAKINNADYSISTGNDGEASLLLNLKPAHYNLDIFFMGSGNYSAVNKTFDINVLKLKSTITPGNTTVFKYKYFYTTMTDNFGNPITDETVSFLVNGNTYTSTTDKNGVASFKNLLNPNAKYSLSISFKGNKYYSAVSKTVSLIVPATTSVVIGNNKLLTNGYLRIYLKSSTLSAISQQTVVIKIGNKIYTKTTNPEGIIVFAPKAGTGTLNISVTYGGTETIIGSNATKNVDGISGSVKNPSKQKIPLVNGAPDIDVMPGSYVMADGDMKYTLLKAQYLETIKRDSYYLYLYNKMSNYVFFKTKEAPNLQHVIVREKWNVIERAINTKVVKANKAGYWPTQISVSLKGKSYTYPQVRDVQDTGYTCGPTSSSMCSQFLKNYYCEKQLAILSKSTYRDGSTTKGLKIGLEKCNFKCSYYYKSSFSKAINELKKGGRALIFHTWYHYVAILDISKDGKKVLVGNPSGDYDYGSHDIPTNWLTVSYMKKMFNNYETSGLIVKLKYNLKSTTKNRLKCSYSSFGEGWTAQNTNERIPQI